MPRNAAMLRMFTRRVGWSVPFFMLDGNCPGIGKSKLVEIIAIIATGRRASMQDYPESNEEMRKTLLSVALEGDRLVFCAAAEGQERPTAFRAGPGQDLRVSQREVP